MQATRVERQIGGRTLSIETGTFAKLAHGSVTVQYGEFGEFYVGLQLPVEEIFRRLML